MRGSVSQCWVWVQDRRRFFGVRGVEPGEGAGWGQLAFGRPLGAGPFPGWCGGTGRMWFTAGASMQDFLLHI